MPHTALTETGYEFQSSFIAVEALVLAGATNKDPSLQQLPHQIYNIEEKQPKAALNRQCGQRRNRPNLYTINGA